MCEKEEEKDMNVIKQRRLESTKMDFASDKAYEGFVKLVNNPPEPNERVKSLVRQYQKRIENSGWKN